MGCSQKNLGLNLPFYTYLLYKLTYTLESLFSLTEKWANNTYFIELLWEFNGMPYENYLFSIVHNPKEAVNKW